MPYLQGVERVEAPAREAASLAHGLALKLAMEQIRDERVICESDSDYGGDDDGDDDVDNIGTHFAMMVMTMMVMVAAGWRGAPVCMHARHASFASTASGSFCSSSPPSLHTKLPRKGLVVVCCSRVSVQEWCGTILYAAINAAVNAAIKAAINAANLAVGCLIYSDLI